MATAASRFQLPALVESAPLRLLTVFVFYIFEGVPMGLFYVAVPAYLASNGHGVGDIAAIVGAFSLPWTLKLVNGFVMDRYTFLAMGRRRIWIIGAQSLMALGFLAGSLFVTESTGIGVLSLLAFVISAATTFQDVAIDSLVVDIMNEDEQAKAGGIMFGAQTFGMAGATAAGGYLLHSYGLAQAFVVTAAFLALGILFAIALRERPGERHLPWTAGTEHPRNREIQIDAWLPLVRQSLKAIFAPASLIILPFLIVRSTPAGISDVFAPVLGAQYLGWSTTEFTNVSSLAQLGAGVLGFAVGGILTSRIGKERMIGLVYTANGLFILAIGLLNTHWSNPALVTTLIWGLEIFGIFAAIAMIPIAMQACSPAVAATQFTIYMAVGNFGRPIGAWIAAMTTAIDPVLLFYTTGALLIAAGVGTTLLRRRKLTPEQEARTAHGAGAAPVES